MNSTSKIVFDFVNSPAVPERSSFQDPGEGVFVGSQQLPHPIESVGGGVIGSGMFRATNLHTNEGDKARQAPSTLFNLDPATIEQSPLANSNVDLGAQYLSQIRNSVRQFEDDEEPQTGFTGHVAVLKGTSQMYVHGGWDGKKLNQDLWMFDFGKDQPKASKNHLKQKLLNFCA
jgi:hypothetical protein